MGHHRTILSLQEINLKAGGITIQTEIISLATGYAPMPSNHSGTKNAVAIIIKPPWQLSIQYQ